MRIRWFMLVASVTSGIALSASCAGSMEDPTGNEPVGSHAKLVSKKREWLKEYHADCQVCFKAFEQCKVGAESTTEDEACQVALDACVRGGLENPADAEDGGVDDADGDDGDDNGNGNGDVNAGGGDQGDGDAEQADGGVDDAGDADGDGKDEGEGNDDEEQDPGKIDLVDDIGGCLDQIRSCLNEPNAANEVCIDQLKSCVNTAIDGAFDDVCNREISACVKERVPEDALQSVRDLCEDSLGVSP